MPGFNVTTDIIVGFPGESDEQWRETMEFVETTGFGHIHVFSFSPREGTKAATMQEPVAEAVKKKRSAELRELASRLRRDFIQQQLHTSATVLWEGRPTDTEASQVFGYTENYTRVCTDSKTAPEAGGVAACKLVEVESQGRFAIVELV